MDIITDNNMTKNKSKCVTAIVMIAAILAIAVAASALAQNAVAISDPNESICQCTHASGVLHYYNGAVVRGERGS